MRRQYFLFLLWAIAPVLCAATSIGQVSENLFGPVKALTHVMIAASYVAGITMVIFTFLQIKAHHQNPKLVPLSIPIVMGVCAAILLALPKLTTMAGNSWAATEQEKRGAPNDYINYQAPRKLTPEEEWELEEAYQRAQAKKQMQQNEPTPPQQYVPQNRGLQPGPEAPQEPQYFEDQDEPQFLPQPHSGQHP